MGLGSGTHRYSQFIASGFLLAQGPSTTVGRRCLGGACLLIVLIAYSFSREVVVVVVVLGDTKWGDVWAEVVIVVVVVVGDTLFERRLGRRDWKGLGFRV